MMENGYSLADIAAATGNNNNDGFGNGNGGWWIILLFLALAGRGFGFGGNDGGQGGYGYSQPIVIDTGRNGGSCCCSPCATQADLAAGFNNSAVLANLNDLALGQAGIQQTLCQGFNGVNTTVLQGFNGVERGFCDLSHQLSDCCCATQRAIDGVKYAIAEQACDTRHTIYNSTRDIIDNANANSRAILDFLTQDKIATLTAENQSLKFQASQSAQNAFITANQEAQTAELIRRLGADCPVPAYVVNAPTPVSFATNCCGQVQFSNGCNTGCGSY